MALRNFKPYTPTRRYLTSHDFSDITTSTPEKGLLAKYAKTGGRNNYGRNTNINKGVGTSVATVLSTSVETRLVLRAL